MFGLSKIWSYAIAALALVAVVGGAIYGVYHAGYKARDAKAFIEAAKAQKKADDASAQLKYDAAARAAAAEEEQRHAKMELDILRTRLAAGDVRLSIPAAVRGDGASTGAGAGQARAKPGEAPAGGAAAGPGLRANELTVAVELPAPISIELLAIAGEGDAAIRDLNQCIDSYNDVKDRINGLK